MTLALLALLGAPLQAAEPTLPFEQYQLDNGLNVILHVDHSLPQVVVDVWYGVGSKDEVAGRTGFAHLFEHLMFMGTTRLPGSGYDDLMEQYGGWNNAWTAEDSTNYYDVGPRELLPTLLWMEADRMDGLARAMTKKKLNLQRKVVLNELRQSILDVPYGSTEIEISPAMYPAGYPYAHPVIGSPEDLNAATVDDVVGFFDQWYVPDDASLVVAGDFEPDQVKPLIQRLFGGMASVPLPDRPAPPVPELPARPLVETTDQVQLPGTMLSWHSPAALSPGDAAMDALATILGEGMSSRMQARLVHDEGKVTELQVYQYSQKLSSIFQVFAVCAEGVQPEEVEAEVQEELDAIAARGPTEDELQRARNAIELQRIQELEDLHSRAETLNRYHFLTGTPDYLAKDLARYTDLTVSDVQAAAATLTLARRQTLRIRPQRAAQGGDK